MSKLPKGSRVSFLSKLAYIVTLGLALICTLSLIPVHSAVGLVVVGVLTFFGHLMIFVAFSIGMDKTGNLQFKSEYEPLHSRYQKTGDALAYRDGLLNMQNKPQSIDALNTFYISLSEAHYELKAYDEALDALNQVKADNKELNKQIKHLRSKIKTALEKQSHKK